MEELWMAAPDSGGGAAKERIVVSVRLRPMSEKEVAAGEESGWECISDTTVIFRSSSIHGRTSAASTAFSFDRVFRSECSTKQVYQEAAKEVALSVVSGINSTIFAYGQTSSGKTYTMTGVTELAMADIFDYINRHEERAFVMKFSGLEIYNETVKDLLNPSGFPLRLLDDPERGIIVDRLTEEIVSDRVQFERFLSLCKAQRHIGETQLNEASSRSHQIIKLTIESSAREFTGKDKLSTLVASVNFVDLAGSERASQTLTPGARLKEGCHINRSLLTLGTVIRKLSKGMNGHVPYRDSKLTRILQPALGGNARTAIICTLCPGESHVEQSRNTLVFASRAKEVVTNAQVNVVMSDRALVKQLQKEVARLESELRRPESTPNTGHLELEALLMDKDNQIKKMEREMKELATQRDLAESQLQVMRRAATECDESSLSALHTGVVVDSPREVQCIEVDNPPMARKRDRGLPPGEESELTSLSLGGEMDDHNSPLSSSAITLEQRLIDARKAFCDPGRTPDESALMTSTRRLALGGSRSCRAVLMDVFASPWFCKPELSEDGTPPDRLLMEFPGRPGDLPGARKALNYHAGLKEIARKQYDNQFISNQFQGTDRNIHEGNCEAVVDVGLDPSLLSFSSSPSEFWLAEFEKKRQKIIELWQTCLVPFVHRTYFFLLFNGDPEDSIYIEVELRRLTYLRKHLSGKGADESPTTADGHGITLETSARNLRQERMMLRRLMHKNMAAEERERLYQRWGIPLDSRQRKVRLVHRLWTKSKSLRHVMESAAVVAKIVGLSEPGKAPRELFGLSVEAARTSVDGRASSSLRWIQGGLLH